MEHKVNARINMVLLYHAGSGIASEHCLISADASYFLVFVVDRYMKDPIKRQR